MGDKNRKQFSCVWRMGTHLRECQDRLAEFDDLGGNRENSASTNKCQWKELFGDGEEENELGSGHAEFEMPGGDVWMIFRNGSTMCEKVEPSRQGQFRL